MAQAPQSPNPKKAIEVNPRERLTLGAIEMVLWRAQPTTLTLQIGSQTWLLVDGSTEVDFMAWLTTVALPPVQVLWWRGQPFSSKVAEQLHPKTLILSGRQVTEAAIATLENNIPTVFWTDRDGTVQWTAQHSFNRTVNPGENNLSPLG